MIQQALGIIALIIYVGSVLIWILALELSKHELRQRSERYHLMMAMLIITSLIPILNTYLMLYKLLRVRVSIVDAKELREKAIRQSIEEAISTGKLEDAKRMIEELEKLEAEKNERE